MVLVIIPHYSLSLLVNEVPQDFAKPIKQVTSKNVPALHLVSALNSMEAAHADFAISFKRGVMVLDQTKSMRRASQMSIRIHKASFAVGDRAE